MNQGGRRHHARNRRGGTHHGQGLQGMNEHVGEGRRRKQQLRGSRQKRSPPQRRATGVPKAASQTLFIATWPQDPWRSA